VQAYVNLVEGALLDFPEEPEGGKACPEGSGDGSEGRYGGLDARPEQTEGQEDENKGDEYVGMHDGVVQSL